MAKLTLIHTNDLHSTLERWPYVAAVIKAEQARLVDAGMPHAYLDAGDFLDMSETLSYVSGGQVAVDLLAAVGCRALTPGNNEIWRMRPDELSALASRAPFSWLAGNLLSDQREPLPGLQDWTMLNLSGLQVAVVGLTELRHQTAPLYGLYQPPFPEPLADSVRAARAAGADLVVFLSHCGLREDREIAATGIGVDAVIGGHSHQALLEPEVYGGVPVAQAGHLGQYVGVLELEYEPVARRVTGWAGRLVPVDPAAVAPDPEALAILERHRQAAEERLSQVLTVLPEPLEHDPVGDSRLGALLAEVLRRRADAEIGLAVGCQIVHGFPAGPLTVGQVMSAFQALYQPTLQAVRGSNLKAMLEQARDPALVTRPLVIGGQRPQGLPLGPIYAAGVSVTPEGDLLVNGEPLDPEREYMAGMPSLLGSGRCGYTACEGNRFITAFVPEQARELMASYFGGVRHA